jgi:hypothetical protein
MDIVGIMRMFALTVPTCLIPMGLEDFIIVGATPDTNGILSAILMAVFAPPAKEDF